MALLGPFNSYLQTDGYHPVVAANGITPLYCFAHARHYFVEALLAQGLNPNRLPPKPPDKARRPMKGLGYIGHLYAIEHRVRGKRAMNNPAASYGVSQNSAS